MKDFRNAKSTYAMSMTITLAVIAVLVLSAPIRAVELSTTFTGERAAGGMIDFALEVDFTSGENIPFDYARVQLTGPENITCNIDIDGNIISGSDVACSALTFTANHTALAGASTFGYGYGVTGEVFTPSTTANTTFNGTFGYGFGGSAPSTLQWDTTWNTSGVTQGEYDLRFFVYVDDGATDYTYATTAPSSLTLSELTMTAPTSGSVTINQAVLSTTTNIEATCRWSTTSQSYDDMPQANAMTAASGGTAHSVTLTGLSAGVTYTRWVACDADGASTAAQSRTFTTSPPPFSGGSGGGSGSGGGASTVTPPGQSASFNLGRVISGEGKQLVLNRDMIAFKTLRFESITELQQNIILAVSAITQNDVPKPLPGRVFQYLSVDYNTGFEAQNVEFDFTVSNAWMNDNNIDPSDVALFRWQNNDWVELETQFVRQEGSEYVFTATSPGFSQFAIGERVTPEPEPTPDPELTPTPEPTPTETEPTPEPEPTEEQPPVVDVTEEESGSLTWLWALIGIIVLVGLVIGGGKYVKHRERVRAYNKYYENKK